MSKRRHSGFAQFPDDGKRAKFVNSVLEGDAILSSHSYFSGSRPTIVFENLSDDEHKRVIYALEGLGRWVEDVKFEPMG